MTKIRNAYKFFVGKHEGRRSLGRPMHRWDNNIKMYLRETGFQNVD
jgi:hypothetical protein